MGNPFGGGSSNLTPRSLGKPMTPQSFGGGSVIRGTPRSGVRTVPFGGASPRPGIPGGGVGGSPHGGSVGGGTTINNRSLGRPIGVDSFRSGGISVGGPNVGATPSGPYGKPVSPGPGAGGKGGAGGTTVPSPVDDVANTGPGGGIDAGGTATPSPVDDVTKKGPDGGGDLNPAPEPTPKGAPDDPPDSGEHGDDWDDDDWDDYWDDYWDDHDDYWDDYYDHFGWHAFFFGGFWYGNLGCFASYPYWWYHSNFYWGHRYFTAYPWYHFWFGYYPIYHSYSYPRYVYYQPTPYPVYRDEVVYYPVYAEAGTVAAPAEEPYIDPDLAEELERLKAEETAVEALGQGAVKFKSGEYAAAAEAFRQAVVAAPKNAVPKFAFAHALFARGEYEYAAFMLRRGMELLPNWPSVGTALHELYGNPDDLVEHTIALRTYLDLREADVGGHFLLAYVTYFSGDLDGAEKQFRKLLETSPDHVQAEAFLIRIAQIRADLEKSAVPETPATETVGEGG